MSALTFPDETLPQNDSQTETILAEQLVGFANEAFVFSSAPRQLEKPGLGPKRFPAPPRSYFADVTPPPLARRHLKNTRVLPSREHILPFLARKGICADIGTRTGDFAWQVLTALEPAKLFLCDRDFNSFDNSPFGTAFEKGILELHEAEADSFLDTKPDGYFDLICIYPGHSHNSAAQSLEKAGRKIKNDGCILCANYTTYAPLEGVKYGVPRAVHEFCHAAGFEIAYLALNASGHQDVGLRKIAGDENAAQPDDSAFEIPDADRYQPDIWEYLIAKYDIRTVLDLGAGAGWSTKWFVDRGIYALGVERSKEAIAGNKCRGNMIEHDYRSGPFIPSMVLDLAWCAGFVDQINEQHIPNFMASLQNCRFICLTHAEPGGAGTGPINCQSNEYWVKKMGEFGFDHDAVETTRLRSCGSHLDRGGFRNLTFFKRKQPANTP
jgi:SAM-dependent methyltransferase